MAVNDDYDNNTVHHMRRDVHDSHTAAQVAKMLATLAMIASLVALALSIWALDKAGDAQSTANRATEVVERAQ